MKHPLLYYLYQNDQQVGPYSVQQILELWQADGINKETQFWSEDTESWQPMVELASTLGAPMPLPRPPRSMEPTCVPIVPKVSQVKAISARRHKRAQWEGIILHSCAAIALGALVIFHKVMFAGLLDGVGLILGCIEGAMGLFLLFFGPTLLQVKLIGWLLGPRSR